MEEKNPDTDLQVVDSFPEFLQPTEHFLLSKLRTSHAIHAQVARVITTVPYQDLHHIELSVAAPELHANVAANVNRIAFTDYKPTVREAYKYFGDNPLEWQLVEFGVFTSSYLVSKRLGKNYKGRINDYCIFQYIFGPATLADV